MTNLDKKWSQTVPVDPHDRCYVCGDHITERTAKTNGIAVAHHGCVGYDENGEPIP